MDRITIILEGEVATGKTIVLEQIVQMLSERKAEGLSIDYDNHRVSFDALNDKTRARFLKD